MAVPIGLSFSKTVSTAAKEAHQSRRVNAVKPCDFAAAAQVLTADRGIVNVVVTRAMSRTTAALLRGASAGDAFVVGYHTGLWVTIIRSAGGQPPFGWLPTGV